MRSQQLISFMIRRVAVIAAGMTLICCPVVLADWTIVDPAQCDVVTSGPVSGTGKADTAPTGFTCKIKDGTNQISSCSGTSTGTMIMTWSGSCPAPTGGWPKDAKLS